MIDDQQQQHITRAKTLFFFLTNGDIVKIFVFVVYSQLYLLVLQQKKIDK